MFVDEESKVMTKMKITDPHRYYYLHELLENEKIKRLKTISTHREIMNLHINILMRILGFWEKNSVKLILPNESLLECMPFLFVLIVSLYVVYFKLFINKQNSISILLKLCTFYLK